MSRPSYDAGNDNEGFTSNSGSNVSPTSVVSSGNANANGSNRGTSFDKNGHDTHYNTDADSTASGSTNGMITLQLQLDIASSLAAQRFPAWMALTVFSVICMVALQSRRGIFNVDNAGEAWVLVVTIISFLIALSMVVAYLIARSLVVGQTPEMAVTALLLALWCAGLPTVMNPDNDIAVSNPTTTAVAPVVTNANLYLFAWISFATTIFLASSLGQEYYAKYLLHDTSNGNSSNPSVPVRVLIDPSKVARWSGALASMTVVLCSAIRTFQTTQCRDQDDDDDDETKMEFCARTKFAIALGLVGMCMAGLMMYLLHLRRSLSTSCELSVASLQLILWCFGVGYITFGKGPGSTIGNLYLSTWSTFILSVVMLAVSLREHVAARAAVTASALDHHDPNQARGPRPPLDDTL